MPVAVISPAGGGDADARATAAALGHQQPSPPTASSVADALLVAGELGDPWLWLLDAGVVPTRGALQALLDVAARFERPPALLASTVLTPEGKLHQASVPVPDVVRAERVLAAVEQRCVALRVARRGSLLVLASALAAVRTDSSFPDRDVHWTSAVLRREMGVLVPDSVAIRSSWPARLPVRDVPARIASSIGTLAELEPEDRAWFATHVVERAVSSLRRRIGR